MQYRVSQQEPLAYSPNQVQVHSSNNWKLKSEFRSLEYNTSQSGKNTYGKKKNAVTVKCLYQNIKITKMSMSRMEFPILQVDGPGYLKWEAASFSGGSFRSLRGIPDLVNPPVFQLLGLWMSPVPGLWSP